MSFYVTNRNEAERKKLRLLSRICKW